MKKVMFGVNAVNAGQRNVEVAPAIIATSTNGGFRMTAPVSRALSCAHGDYMMFLNTIDGVEAAIRNNDPNLVAYCEEHELEFGTPEAAIAIHKAFDQWFVAKGIVLKDGKGNYQTTSERLTKKDKVTYATQNFDAMYNAALEGADEETVASLTRDGITKEEQIDILSNFVMPKEIKKYQGCKLANNSKLTGIGAALTGTDSNVWNQLKEDLDDKESVNRIFEIDLSEPYEMEVSNGYENVTVVAYALGASKDEAPIVRGSKDAE